MIPRCIDGVMIATIETLEDEYTAIENDYIIKGMSGEFYPCKPDIFKKTYEKELDEHRFTEEELDKFTNKLNFDIQYLGLNKKEAIEIISSLYN